MKKIVSILTVLSAIAFASCSDIKFGDGAFSNPPESSGATLEVMFSSKINAERVLWTSYANLPYGISTGSGNRNKLGGNILESITDLQHSWRGNAQDGPRALYYSGGYNSSVPENIIGAEAYRFGHEVEYTAIRYAWMYIENAHKIPDITDGERNKRIAEAKINIAIAYFELLRYVGGVPLLDHAIDVNEPMKFPRATFAMTVDFIVNLLNEAIGTATLPWKHDNPAIDDGRMTKAAASAMKLRVLCFAASGTFNSNEKWHSAANDYTCYGNYSVDRWKAAEAAGVEFMTLAEGGYYGLVMPTEQTHQARRIAFRKAYFYRGTTESIISIRRANEQSINSISDLSSGPTLNYVNMFPWADGDEFNGENFDWANPTTQPFFANDGIGGALGTPTRDPRLYETVVVPGDKFRDGTVAPIHYNHPNSEVKTNEEATGFMTMKFNLQTQGDREASFAHWPYMRYAEVLLNYAEAISEANDGPTSEAYDLVDLVRGRVGLRGVSRDFDKTDFRELLLAERALEFGFEEVRWFDMTRWGLQEDFQKPLFRLISMGENDHISPTQFTFEKKDIKSRSWAISTWNSRWYFSPIPRDELDKNYGMTQNPGW